MSLPQIDQIACVCAHTLAVYLGQAFREKGHWRGETERWWGKGKDVLSPLPACFTVPQGWVRMVMVTLDLCVSVWGYDMLLFMSKVTSPRGLPSSSCLHPSGSFACAVVREYVYCLELTIGFSLCPPPKRRKKKQTTCPHTKTQQNNNNKKNPSHFSGLVQTRADPQRAVGFATLLYCVLVLCERPSLNLWGFVQKDITDSLIQSAEPQLHHHDG